MHAFFNQARQTKKYQFIKFVIATYFLSFYYEDLEISDKFSKLFLKLDFSF